MDQTLKKYKSHSHREHIYKIPDTYIGSVDSVEVSTWKVVSEKKMKEEKLSYIPGLYKIVDEVIVNAWDQYIRCISTNAKVTFISISIDAETGVVEVKNDGKGIDVLIHPQHNIYTVEMIFGKLLTSTNYDENEERITGGKNGYGAKLTNIFSKWFEVETVDKRVKKKYSQRFSDNMKTIEKPKISNVTAKTPEYTKVRFLPDFERFGIQNWTPDMIDIFKRRAYEIAACSDVKLQVHFNDSLVPIRNFKEFSSMYNDSEIVYESAGTRWEIAAAIQNSHAHVSFVNGIFTSKGGKHVDHVLQIISKKMVDIIQKREKVTVKPNYVKEHLFLFVNCIIVNPSFDSQTKDTLTTVVSKFGSQCKLSDKFFDALISNGLIEKIMDLYNFKEARQLKKTDGKKKNKLYGIPKLDDANEAGGRRSSECTLILTEGDSAKAMAISGLSVIGRDLFGVFPLRGKVINAREKITTKQGKLQVMNNTELIHLKQIIGLENNVKYQNTSKLRYGSILIMTDQDFDGSHIKGLIINWLDTFWPELLKIQGFVQCMQTPIIKAFHKNKEKLFYSIQSYNSWKNSPESQSWKTKYYKGLGTSTTNEAKAYFKTMNKHIYSWDTSTQNALDLAFNRERTHDRKLWLQNYNETSILDENESVPYADFVNKELIHFSNYDLKRSLPHIMDGLKPSQRKILFSCFKRKLKNEIRVSQLAGYVSEHSGYHHGEESLNKAIISMAQTYVGSNNINLLEPNGQFGTRILGGKDAGSPRYLHTNLSPTTFTLFPSDDFDLLNYLDDDGIPVEPEYYTPIIPMVLCNGCHGIGTGYSTVIPSYNPRDLIQCIRSKLNNDSIPSITPYFKGFQGAVFHDDDEHIVTKGMYKIKNYKTILVHELPIGTWIDSYKSFLDEVVTTNTGKATAPKKKSELDAIKSYKSHSTETSPHFEIEIDPAILSDWLNKNAQSKDSNIDFIEKTLRLTSKISMMNMHLYSAYTGKVKKYSHYSEIIDEYFSHRLTFYEQRKKYILEKLLSIIQIFESKSRFITSILNNEIDMRKLTKAQVEEWLKSENFATDKNKTFNYLTHMPLYQMTCDMVKQLNDELAAKRNEHESISKTSIENMWRNDLALLEKSL